jgi:hypothetical protein
MTQVPGHRERTENPIEEIHGLNTEQDESSGLSLARQTLKRGSRIPPRIPPVLFYANA